MVCLCPGAAVVTCRPGGLTQKCPLSQSGGQKSDVKVAAGPELPLGPWGGSFLASAGPGGGCQSSEHCGRCLVTPVSASVPWPSPCVSVSARDDFLLEGHQSCWMRATLTVLSLLDDICKDPISKSGHMHRSQGVRTSVCLLGGTVQPLTDGYGTSQVEALSREGLELSGGPGGR